MSDFAARGFRCFSRYDCDVAIAAKMPESKEPAKPDRITVDITGFRDRIENAKKTPEWQELNLVAKIRVVIAYGLQAIEKGE